MPIQIACPKCNAKYQVPSKFKGKAVKCQKCNTSFKATAQSAPANQPKAKVPAQSQQELQKYGIDGPIVAETQDIFASPPPTTHTANMLGNHALDPGFSPSTPATREQPEPELGDLFVNPAITAPKPKKPRVDGPRNKRPEPKKITQQVWFLMLITLGPLSLICNLIPLIAGAEWIIIAHGFSVLCSFIGFAISIWSLNLAYEATGDATTVILCLFVPFFMLYILIKHWSVMAPSFWASLVLTGIQIAYVATVLITVGSLFLE